MEDLRFPVGKFHYDGSPSPEQKQVFLDEIAQTPNKLRGAVTGLTDTQLDTPYRPGGWTVRQVVHHVPDSHLNSYTRFKLALTEEEPTIRPYDEAKWAELSDSRDTPIETSLTMLDALHDRWTILLRNMTEEEFRRTLRHPDMGVMSLDAMLS